MPQGPIQTIDFKDGTKTALYINGTKTIKSQPGMIAQVNVLVAGAAGTVNDCADTASVATANQVAAIPATVGVIELGFPCATGITIAPGAGQVVSVSYR